MPIRRDAQNAVLNAVSEGIRRGMNRDSALMAPPVLLAHSI